jgi:hypothetical protein
LIYKHSPLVPDRHREEKEMSGGISMSVPAPNGPSARDIALDLVQRHERTISPAMRRLVDSLRSLVADLDLMSAAHETAATLAEKYAEDSERRYGVVTVEEAQGLPRIVKTVRLEPAGHELADRICPGCAELLATDDSDGGLAMLVLVGPVDDENRIKAHEGSSYTATAVAVHQACAGYPYAGYPHALRGGWSGPDVRA